MRHIPEPMFIGALILLALLGPFEVLSWVKVDFRTVGRTLIALVVIAIAAVAAAHLHLLR